MAKKWTMPKWMEPYREMFANTGGNSVDELMNDRTTHVSNNAVRAALIVAVDSQVLLLRALREAGCLGGASNVPRPPNDRSSDAP